MPVLGPFRKKRIKEHAIRGRVGREGLGMP